MKKLAINIIIITTVLSFGNIAHAQWSLTTAPAPIWTNQNVGIGTSTPVKRLQIVSLTTESVGLDGFPTLTGEPLQLRLSSRKISNYNSTSLGQNPMAPFTTTFDTDWDIDNDEGILKFHYIDNLAPSFRSPFSLSPNGGTFYYDLTVAGNTNTQALTATDITANNLNVNNINISKLTIGNLRPVTSAYSNYALSVNGNIISKKAVVQVSDWADKVFQKNYRLMSLSEIEAFVKQYKHLPEIPSESEIIENGVDVGEMNKLLLQKVEELTLHLIKQEKIIKALEVKVAGLTK